MYSIFRAERTPDQWRLQPGRILFAWAIMNPNGPTLSCIGLRETIDRSQVEVFYRWLHFLGGETYVLGYLDNTQEGVERDLHEVLAHAFRQSANGAFRRFPLVPCFPNIVTEPAILAAEDVRSLFGSTQVLREGDWGRERYLLAKYGSRFFERAAGEARAALDLLDQGDVGSDTREYIEMTRLARGRLPAFRDWQPGEFTSRNIALGDVQAWWTTVTQPDFVGDALLQLAQMWAGASAVTSLPTRETFEDVREFFDRHQHRLWPDTWTTSSLRQSVGLPAEEPRNDAAANGGSADERRATAGSD